ncbi:MAG: glycosyl transferase family 1, partial [Alphaproteobacteria bacterium]
MISGKRILYVTHRFPYPPAGGAKVRAYHAIRHLAQRNQVTVAAPVRDAEERAAVTDLATAEGVEVLAAPISAPRALVQSAACAAIAQPASMGYFRPPGLVRRLRRWMTDALPDLIVVH